jgi:hypothetical protein
VTRQFVGGIQQFASKHDNETLRRPPAGTPCESLAAAT